MKILYLALRSLTRFRLYTFINVLGLALSLACVIIIGRYVYSEWTTDHFNSNHKRLYLTVQHFSDGTPPRLFTSGNILSRNDYTDPLDMPEIEKKSSFVSLRDVNIEVDDYLYNAHILATDSLFLQLLDYPLSAGDRLSLLTEPNDAVITSSYARKLFGDEDPIGKTIGYSGYIVTVKGVIEAPSTKSSLSFDILISQKLQWRWPPVNFNSIALAVPQIDYEKLNERFKENAQKNQERKDCQLLPLDALYFDTVYDKGDQVFKQGNKNTTLILTLVAVLVLFVGIFNFIQLCSVILIKRSRELGMKKVFGASPRQLFTQVYIENLALTLLALVIGWSLIEITKGWQEQVLQIFIVDNRSFNFGLSVTLLFALPLVSSFYPFFQSERRKPGVRSVFLVAQYCITFCLIISSLFFMRQLNLMLNKPPGFKTENIIKVWFERPFSKMYLTDDEIEQQEKERIFIKEKVQSSPIFTGSCYGLSPYEFKKDIWSTSKVRVADGEWHEIAFYSVEPGYFEFYDIPVTEIISSSPESMVILNETARKLLSGRDNEWTQLEFNNHYKYNSLPIKGFASEFQITHLSQLNIPLALIIESQDAFARSKFMASYAPGKRQEAIRFLRQLHDETVGGEFSYTFVKDEIGEIYSKDRLVSTIYSVFAFIAILVSSLGLFSLSLFDVQQRYQEIAIRKVNGATTSTIMRFLLRKYYKLLLLAFVIAIPISWLAITKYVENFAFKAPISWWLFAIALLITVGISLLTLIWQIRKAARTNPAEAIKTE